MTTDERIQKLQAGAALVMFDRTFRSAAQTVTIYGIIFAGIGVILVFAGPVGWIGVAAGAALLVEASYIRRVRTPRVVLIAGLTLAAFAVWLIGSFIIAWINNDASRGRGIIAGCFLAYGAWNLLTSYRNYKLLLEHSDPKVNEEVRRILDCMRTDKLDHAMDIAEWKIRGFGEKGLWRMKSEDDLLIIANFEDKTFGFGGYVEKAYWFRRTDVRVEHEGDKWMSKNLNAKLILPNEELKVELSPEMLNRLDSMLLSSGAMSAGFGRG